MPRQLKHRSRSEIISSILEVTNGNKIRVTEIQFKTYLSYNILKEYLVHLLQCDLIEYIEGERTFKTTPKGMQVLMTCNRMEELFVKSPQSTNLDGFYFARAVYLKIHVEIQNLNWVFLCARFSQLLNIKPIQRPKICVIYQ